MSQSKFQGVNWFFRYNLKAVAIGICALIMTAAPVSAATAIEFGTLVTDPAHVQTEAASGVHQAMMEIYWDRYEPTQGQFSSSYIASIKTELAAYQAAGQQITLALGTYDTPSWVFQIPNSTYVNQAGTSSTQLNVVFNQQVRNVIAAYYAEINHDLGFKNFADIRLTSGGNAEMLYPDGGYWAYDANALGGSELPLTLAPNPLPHWVPGSTSATTSQIADWAKWYVGGLVDVTNWQINTLTGLGYAGSFDTLTPGSGVHPDRYQSLITASMPLDPVMGVGAAWYEYYTLLPSRSRVMVYISSVADNSGDNDSCEPGDSSVNLSSMTPDSWSATRYQSAIAHQLGMTVGGENPGYNQPASLNTYYADQSSNGMMANALRQAQSCGFTAFYWAHDERFWTYNTVPFSLYAARIAAINGPSVTASASPHPVITGDINNDGVVNAEDLSILLSDWQTSTAMADLNHDGRVNVTDLSILLVHWST